MGFWLDDMRERGKREERKNMGMLEMFKYFKSTRKNLTMSDLCIWSKMWKILKNLLFPKKISTTTILRWDMRLEFLFVLYISDFK